MDNTAGIANADHPKFDGHIACIGASASGLDALERFFGKCPADMGHLLRPGNNPREPGTGATCGQRLHPCT